MTDIGDLKYDVWDRELGDDIDREFLLEGIKDGFHVVSSFDFSPAECDNYNSALDVQTRPLVEKQIRTEILEGRYKITTDKPTIVSALGAVPKSNGGIRLIHDASRPAGQALNDYAQLELNLQYQSIKDVEKLICPGVFFSKVDLKQAHRSVGIHPGDFSATGLKWRFSGQDKDIYLYDTRLPFGSKLSPGVFHRLTQSVRRMMSDYGYHNVVVYLDDFPIAESVS